VGQHPIHTLSNLTPSFHSARPAAPSFISGSTALVAQGANFPLDIASAGTDTLLFRPGTIPPASVLPFISTSVLPSRPNLPDDPVIPVNGFATHDEAEKAFIHLLKKAGIDPTWTWDRTMRAIITDPLYKSLGTLAEKKAAWQKVRLPSHCNEPSHPFLNDLSSDLKNGY
jgi:hypothetical protein